jgi:ribonuclease R
MKKARYSVENAGHYGLAFKWYTHFTSPIRRYPDLVVHRLLREYADGPVSAERRDHLERALDKAADIASKREKLADEVERESIKIKQTEYMETRIGESFDGVISGMIPNGFFVELSDTLIEGMVSLASLKDDYYVLDALTRRLIGSRSGRTFHLGMRVHVMVVRADRRLRHIDFELIRAEETTPAKPMKSVRGKKGARPAHPVRAAGKRPPGLIRGSKKSSGRRFSGNPKRRGRR